jgi:hypothetical protein
MAAVFGGTAADAVDALSSALKGEMDPIERYGVTLNQAAIDAQKAADGNAKPDRRRGPGRAEAGDPGTDHRADRADRPGSGPRSRGRRRADPDRRGRREERRGEAGGGAAAGGRLKFWPTLASVATWAGQNKGTVIALAGVAIGGLAAATLIVNGVMTAWTTIARMAAAAQWIWNAAMSANPLGLIIIAVAAVVAGIVLLINHFGGLGNIIKATGQVFSSIWDAIPPRSAGCGTRSPGWVTHSGRCSAGSAGDVAGGGRHQVDCRQNRLGDQQGEGGR